MQCYICGADIGDNIGACGDCAQKRSSARAENAQQALSNISYSRSSDNRKTFFGLLFAAVFLAIGFYRFSDKGSVPEGTLMSMSGQPRAICEPGRECVVAYMTPWCGACKTTLTKMPQLRSITQSKPGYDFELIIGQDSSANLRAFGRKSRTDALLDFDGKAFNGLGRGGVPRFYRINSDGKITEAFSGYPQYPNATMQAEWIREKFDL